MAVIFSGIIPKYLHVLKRGFVMAKISKKILEQAKIDGLTTKQIAAQNGVTRQAVWAMKKKYAGEIENKDTQKQN